MRSQLAERLGAQEPQLLHLPPGVHSLAAAEEAIELADSYLICDGNPLAESQRITLRAACGERADGTWAAARVGDFGPRQGTGKNDKINARELAGLILFGERLIIHTAHEFPTANESFLRMVAIFDAWDDLRKRVARIRYANGEQGIELLTGQRLKYRARTGGSGRGFAKADLVVYDEAQHLARSHVAASGPAKLANPNSQSWYAGSGGFSTSAVAWDLRRQAILGNGGRLAYTEMTGETIEVVDGRIEATTPDPDDRSVWYACIPGLGRWVTEEGVETMRDELGPDFSREGLCVWDPEPLVGDATEWEIVTESVWLDFADPKAARGKQVAFGVDVGSDRMGHVAVAWERPDRRVQVMLADTGLSPLRTPERLAQLAHDWRGPVLLGGPSAALEDDVPGSRVLSGREFAEGCGRLADLLDDGKLRHGNQPELTAAVKAAVWRSSGTAGERSLQLKDAPTVGPLAAVVRAIQGLSDAKKPPPTPKAATTAKRADTADLSTLSF